MRHPHRTLLALLALVAIASCRHADEGPATPAAPPTDLEVLHAWMTGTFDSQEQAATHPGKFFPIRLVMVPIWSERPDGPWLYVEQAAFSRLDRPYRQRVYRLLEAEDGSLLSEVYVLPGNALRYTGGWAKPELWTTTSPEQLVLRDGCTIRLRRGPEGSFVGSTVGNACGSRLGGASFATSEVSIADGLLTSLDRGWDAEGEQVWGSEHGPYLFIRSDLAPPAR